MIAVNVLAPSSYVVCICRIPLWCPHSRRRIFGCRGWDHDLSKEDARLIESKILGKMKTPGNVIIKKGWFPKSTEKMKSEKYVLVYIDTGLYAATYNGIQYFYPRLCRGGVIMIPHYQDENMRGIRAAIDDLEEKICPFIMKPLCDKDSTVMISRP